MQDPKGSISYSYYGTNAIPCSNEITYDDFKKMSKEQRNQIIRDIKLKTII